MKKKVSIGVVMAILAAVGYGGYAIIKKSELDALRSGETPVFEVARVIDGDTFELSDGDVVRILGIDAPDEGECYFEESKEALRDLIEGQRVELRKDVTGSDEFGRLLRYVILPSESPLESSILVDEYMISGGYAVLNQNPRDKLYERLLVEERERARREGRGMWQECEVEKTERSQADVSPPSAECTIKGNISGEQFGRKYFLEECQNYGQVKIDPSRGEGYFCSEVEAVRAGFEKAGSCP